MRGACDPARARIVFCVVSLFALSAARSASAQSISGRVTDAATGLGAQGVLVQILDSSGNTVVGTGTDAQGLYMVAANCSGSPIPTCQQYPIALGTYYVRTNASLASNYLNAIYATPQNVQCPSYQACSSSLGTGITLGTGNPVVTGIDLALARGGKILGAGTNAATGAPLNGPGSVEVYDASGTKLGLNNINFGAYSTPVLPPGTYFLATNGFESAGYLDERYDGVVCKPFSCTVVTGPGVVVTAGTNTSLDFALSPGARISGTIIDQFSGNNLGVNVTAFDLGGNAVAQVQNFGTYTLGLLPLGTYRVATSSPGSGPVHEVFDNIPCTPACNLSAGTQVVLQTVNETRTANFELIQDRVITGRVTNTQTGAGINGVSVHVFNASGTFVAGSTTETARGVTGRYRTFVPLPAGGPYYVRTTSGASMGFTDQVYGGPACTPSCNVTSGTPITVVAFQQVENVNIALSQASASFSGTVSSGGTGLGGVTVRVLNTAGAIVASTTTSSAPATLGSYTTSVLPTPGPYYIGTFDASAQGFLDQLHNGVVCMPNCQLSAGTQVSLAPSGTVINFSLLRPNRITGTVTGESGALAGVTVQIVNATTLQNVTSTSTAANGTYTSGNLAAGSYFVRTSNALGYFDEVHSNVQCFGCNLATAGGTPIVFSGSAGGAATVDFALARGGQITGTVIDEATGAALGGTSVAVLDAAGRILATATTSATGNYGTTGLPSGTYFLRAATGVTFHIAEVYDDLACVPCTISNGTPIPVAAGATVSGIDFALSTGGRFSGTVRDAATSAPIQGIIVDIVNSSGASAAFAGTAANGMFTTIGLPPGTYFARARANANGPASHGYISEVFDDQVCSGCNPLSGTPIVVPPNVTTTNVDFMLNKGTRIAGRVEDAQTSQPLAGVSVMFFSAAGLQATRSENAVTNAAGEYLTLDGLPAGTFYARTSNGLGYLNELYSDLPCVGTCVPTGGTGISVPGTIGTQSGIDFSLPRGGRIAGTVTAAGGAPLAGVGVGAFNAAGVLVGGGVTNASGDYITAGLPAGTYYVRMNNSLGYVNQVYSGLPCIGCDPQNIGTPVTVTAASTVQDIDFVLQPGGRIAGTVTDSVGTALAGVNVEIYADPAAKPAATAVTNSLGAYLTPNGLPAGNYTARTTNGLGFINERFDNVPCTADCSPAVGTPIAVTPPSTTNGINFALDADADFDADGILSSIDTNAAAHSDDFSDVPQGGLTAGTIIARGGWVVNLLDASPGGVTATLSGVGTTAAILHACSTGGSEELRLDTAGESALITCNADSGSITVKALAAFPKIELQKTVDGITTLIELVPGQTVTFGSPVVADPANVDPLQITMFDTDGVLGNFALDPGESAEVVKAPSGAITVTVFEGTVPVTIGDDVKTLGPGQVAVADSGGFVLCTPLVFSALTANPAELTKPNHKMVPVMLSPTLGGVCGTASCRVVDVTSNEPVNGADDGDTAPDWSFGSGLSMSVRSERAGSGTGRVYTITVECTDDGGGVQRRNVTVSVPMR